MIILCASTNIVRVLKFKDMVWVRHVA